MTMLEWMVSWTWLCLHATGWSNGQWIEWLRLCCTGPPTPHPPVGFRATQVENSAVLSWPWECVCERKRRQEQERRYKRERRQERKHKREDKRGKAEREDQRDVEMGIKSFSSEDWHWLDWMESTPTPLQPTQPITVHFKQLYTLLFNLIIFSFWLRVDKIQILGEFEWPHFSPSLWKQHSFCFLLSLPSYFSHWHKTFYATYQIQHTTMSEKGQLYS